MGEVIARNTHSATLLANQLAADGQLDPATTIEPVFVGKTGWDQRQYMEFWFSVIGGYELTPSFIARDTDGLRETAQQAFAAAGIDMDLMVGNAAAAARAGEYFKMSTAFASLIKGGQPATPVTRLIRMIDTQLSLGAQAERAMARQLGIRVMNISAVRPASPLDFTEVNHSLADDTAQLITYGATVFDTSNNRVRLILEDEAA